MRQHVSPSHIPEVVLPMPTLIPHDLSNWILGRHSDLQEMSVGDIKKMLELTSLQSKVRETCRGFRGMRVGEARNPGPKSFLKGAPWSRKRPQRTLLDSDSDALAPLFTSGRFGLLSSEDEESENANHHPNFLM